MFRNDTSSKIYKMSFFFLPFSPPSFLHSGIHSIIQSTSQPKGENESHWAPSTPTSSRFGTMGNAEMEETSLWTWGSHSSLTFAPFSPSVASPPLSRTLPSTCEASQQWPLRSGQILFDQMHKAGDRAQGTHGLPFEFFLPFASSLLALLPSPLLTFSQNSLIIS